MLYVPHADYERPGTQGPLHAKACLLNVPIKKSAADYEIGLCSTEHLMIEKIVIKDLSRSKVLSKYIKTEKTSFKNLKISATTKAP